MSTVRLIACALGFCICSGTGMAQLDTVWTAQISSVGGPFFYDAVELSDGSFAIVGVANPDAPSLDAFVARVSAAGAVLWTRTFGRLDSSEQFSAVTQLPNGDILAVGNRNLRSVWLMGISPQGDSLWSRQYYAVPQTRGQDVAVLADGNVAVAGIRLSATGHSEAWLLKCDLRGDTLWTRTYSGENLSVVVRVRERADQTLTLSGHMVPAGEEARDAWLIRLNANGSQVWSRTYGTPTQDFVNDEFSTVDAHYLCGRTNDSYGFVAKAAVGGDSLWFRQMAHDEGWSNQQLRGMVVRQTGSILAVGWSGPSSTSENVWVQAMTSDGNSEWSWVCPWYAQSRAYGVIPVRNSGYLIFGAATVLEQRYGLLIRVPPPLGLNGFIRDVASLQPVSDVFVGAVGNPWPARSDENGQYNLELRAGTYDIVLSGVCIEPDTVFGVEVEGDSVTTHDFSVGRPTIVCDRTSLNMLARNHLISADSFFVYNGGSGHLEYVIESRPDAPQSPWLSVVPAGGRVAPQHSQAITVIVTADTTDEGAHDYYGALLIHSNGCPDTLVLLPVVATVLDVPSSRSPSPYAATLHPAFPNPFNAITTLTFDLPHPSDVTLRVFNLAGQSVAVLKDGSAEAGRFRVNFDGSSLPSGLYICRLSADHRFQQQKLLLLK